MTDLPAQAGNDKISREMNSVHLAAHAFGANDIQTAFSILETEFSKQFYEDMPEIYRSELNPVIKAAFNDQLDDWARERLAQRLTDAGLPVIANGTSDRELLRILGAGQYRFGWILKKKAMPQPLGPQLSQERINMLKRVNDQLEKWEMWAAAEALVWDPHGDRGSKITLHEISSQTNDQIYAGVRIVFNAKSRIDGIPMKSLTLRNVNVYPYAYECIIGQSTDPKFSRRSKVVIDVNDRIIEGLKQTY